MSLFFFDCPSKGYCPLYISSFVLITAMIYCTEQSRPLLALINLIINNLCAKRTFGIGILIRLSNEDRTSVC